MKDNHDSGNRIKLLGAASIVHREGKPTWKRKKTLLLLAYLIVEERCFSRSHLAAVFWPDLEEASGLKHLRQAIYEIKQLIPASSISVDRQNIRIQCSDELSCDYWDLIDILSNHNQGLLPMEKVLFFLNEVKGEFLEGVRVDDLELLENWLYAIRESVKRKVCMLLNDCTIKSLIERETEQAHCLLEKWKMIDEFDEHIYEHLTELYHQAGDNQRAVTEFNVYSDKLHQELDMRPSKHLQRRIEQIKSGQMQSTEIELCGFDIKQEIPETKYLNRNGVYVAYQVFGQGAKTLVIISGFMSHLEMFWESKTLRPFLEKLSKEVRIVLFDRRGAGMSDRLPRPSNIIETVSDVKALVEEIGCEEVSILGISEGGPAALQFSISHGDLVEKLILYGTSPVWVKNRDWDAALSIDQFDAWKNKMVRSWGDGSSIVEFSPSKSEDNREVQWWAKCMRLSSSPSEISKLLEAIKTLDVSHLLGKVASPTLIIHKTSDRVVRFEAAMKLHEGIKNSQLLEIEGTDHWVWTEHTEEIIESIARFLRGAS